MKRPSTSGSTRLPVKQQRTEIQSFVPSFNSLLDAFNYVCRIFPSESFSPPIPPFVLKNQLYALSCSRTHVDKELNELVSAGTLRTLRLFDDEFSVVIMFTSDYERSLYLNETTLSKELINKFTEYVRKTSPPLNVTYDSVRNLFTDKDISTLIQVGILTIRSPCSWWLSSPQLGRFISSYKTGLRKLKDVFLRARLKELLLSDLLRRDWKKKASLGPLYILLDQLGSGAITKFETSSGLLLRLST
uniref:Serine/threonine-protein kinase 19 n=1 Tax=Schistocephalus solidus TaxID=70667 RepID=A0A0X3NW03_SCHSO